MRKLTTGDGAVVHERLDSIDAAQRTYTYSITDSPLPLEGYQATIRVADGGGAGSAEVHWSSEFEPAGAPETDVVAIVEGIYQAGFDSLKERFRRLDASTDTWRGRRETTLSPSLSQCMDWRHR